MSLKDGRLFCLPCPGALRAQGGSLGAKVMPQLLRCRGTLMGPELLLFLQQGFKNTLQSVCVTPCAGTFLQGNAAPEKASSALQHSRKGFCRGCCGVLCLPCSTSLWNQVKPWRWFPSSLWISPPVTNHPHSLPTLSDVHSCTVNIFILSLCPAEIDYRDNFWSRASFLPQCDFLKLDPWDGSRRFFTCSCAALVWCYQGSVLGLTGHVSQISWWKLIMQSVPSVLGVCLKKYKIHDASNALVEQILGYRVVGKKVCSCRQVSYGLVVKFVGLHCCWCLFFPF